jgi:hypothetical protein
MVFALRLRLTRCVARLMCWVLLLGWFAGAANACVLLERMPQPLRPSVAHVHTGADMEPHHHQGLSGMDDGHNDEDHGPPPGQQACKHLCDGEQQAVAQSGAGDLPWLHCLASATAASCLLVPPLTPARAPRPDAGTLPAPPPIPIAFLRLTI